MDAFGTHLVTLMMVSGNRVLSGQPHIVELHAVRPAQRLAGERCARLMAPGQAALTQPKKEWVEAIPSKEGLALENHQRYATMACLCHEIGILQPAAVNFFHIFYDVFDRLVVIQPLDSVEAFLHVCRPVFDFATPDQIRNLVYVVEALSTLRGVTGQAREPVNVRLLFRR